MNVSAEKLSDFKKLVRMVDDFDFLKESLSRNSELKIYVHAIWLGYLDACRTFNEQKKLKKSDKAIESLAKSIKRYLDNDCDFDHDSYCKLLVDSYAMHYGQAQKIVNMAFKYLYCIAKDSSLLTKFDNCHMPLDGIMLEWLYRNAKDENGKKVLKKSKIGPWSKMEKGSKKQSYDKDGYYTYSYYQSLLLKHFKNQKPLELDFEYWRDMSLTLSTEQYLRNFSEEEKKDNIPVKWVKAIQNQ